MQNYGVYVSRLAPKKEPFAPGHRACIGCGEALAVRLACKALPQDVIVANATGCMEVVSSQFPMSAWRMPWIHTLFENTAAVASGVESALTALVRKGKKADTGTKVVAIAGDGGTSDIGIQALSGALERGHDLLYICFDNEAYMNTGIQRSSATPFGASTTTSPAGRKSIGQKTWKKNMAAIAAAHDIPYVATASHSYPFDLMEKVAKGVAAPGPAYVHIHSVCPTGWRSNPDLSVRLGRLAVQTGVFPLYEIENGKYKMSMEISEFKPLQEYLKYQGRFRHLSEDNIKEIQKRVIEEYNKIKEKAQ
ncbi:MAG TPA: pyruvate synthase subunit beta [Dehalococcoidia bacterium]|nr:pyruvate synthase subunit beta [Dehalococcoidia bacterium]